MESLSLCMGYSSLANWYAFPSWFLQPIIWHCSLGERPPENNPFGKVACPIPNWHFPVTCLMKRRGPGPRLSASPLHLAPPFMSANYYQSQNQWQIWYKQFCRWFRSHNNLTYLNGYETCVYIYIFPIILTSYLHISICHNPPSASTTLAPRMPTVPLFGPSGRRPSCRFRFARVEVMSMSVSCDPSPAWNVIPSVPAMEPFWTPNT